MRVRPSARTLSPQLSPQLFFTYMVTNNNMVGVWLLRRRRTAAQGHNTTQATEKRSTDIYPVPAHPTHLPIGQTRLFVHAVAHRQHAVVEVGTASVFVCGFGVGGGVKFVMDVHMCGS